jgi:hypothetical protein
MTAAGPAPFIAAVRPRAVGLSLLAATLAAALALYRPSVSPLGLHLRSLRIAAASTTLLVGSPRSLPVSSDAYSAAENSAVLAGNLLVSPAVTDYIGARLGVDPRSIETSAPVTANNPAALIQPGSSGGPLDIVKLPDRYELEVQADPTVPVLVIYAQGPSGARAVALANAAAQGVIRYQRHGQEAAGVPATQRITIEQIGTAQGGTAQTDGLPQIALLVFAAAFVASLSLLSAIGGRRSLPRWRGRATATDADALLKPAPDSSN